MEMNIKANQSPETPETSEQSRSQLLTKADFEAGIARLKMLETEITQLKLKTDLIINMYIVLASVIILMALLLC